ncbi:hypothetical protein SAMN06272759_1309 [Novosphingobium sp. B1]|nr:hypothetical protein SAMN06272759_1309 [Novosphingobium sp. B1]
MGAKLMLGDYLAEAARKKHVYGLHDCCTFPCDWVVLNGWPDPMASWRGGYVDDAPARGGLLDIFARGMDGVGLPRTQNLMEGDVGVLTLLGQEAGAIFTGRRWALVAPRGMAFTTANPSIVIAAWRVRCG